MGTVQHQVVAAVVHEYAAEDALAAGEQVRALLRLHGSDEHPGTEDLWAGLLVGPVESPVNGWSTWVLAECGSKVGWDARDRMEEAQRLFAHVFSPFGTVFGVGVGEVGHETFDPDGAWTKVP